MSRAVWDEEAASFDDEPDHGLGSPETRTAWRELLTSVLPPAPARVVDLGCGTGTLTHLLTDEGYIVDGLDFSPAMIERARAKVPGARFLVADAAMPPLASGSFDVVLSRHVLWAMDAPRDAFARWVDLLRSEGTVVLVEGSWSTGGGLTAAQTREIVLSVRREVSVRLLPEAIYWGKDISDERYIAVSGR